VVPVLIGPEAQVREKAKAFGVSLEGVVVRDPASDPRRADFEARLPGIAQAQGDDRREGEGAGGLAALLRRAGSEGRRGCRHGFRSQQRDQAFLPAFEVVKMQPAFKRASSVFIMAFEDKVYF